MPPEQSPQTSQAVPLSQEPHHELMYETPDMKIYDVFLPPGQSTVPHQHDHDYIFITFGKSEITVSGPGQPTQQLKLPSGSVRFAHGGFSHTVTADGSQPFHNLSIEFLNPALTRAGCSCRGLDTDSICGCPNAQPLPANWSLRIGHLFLAGVTLEPGAVYDINSNLPNRFLVAVTPFDDILDETHHEPATLHVRLPEGRFHWLSPGPHKIQNASSQPVRFVKVEF